MPWYIKYAPPPESSAVSSSAGSKSGGSDISEHELRTAEAEKAVEALAQRVSDLEAIASGRVKPAAKGGKVEQKTKLQYLWDPCSPSCQGPALFLQKTGLKYEEKRHELDEKAIHSNRVDPLNVKFNFNHALPTLVDGDFGVFESHSILRYLAEKYLPGSQWYPDDLVTRTKINNYLDWQAYTIHATFITVGLALLPGQQDKGIDQSKAYIELAKNAIYGSNHKLWNNRPDNGLVNQLKIVNDRWLEKTPFLAGSQATIADIALYAHLGYIIHMFKLSLSEYPKINAWNAKMDKEFAQLSARKEYLSAMATYGEAFGEVFSSFRK